MQRYFLSFFPKFCTFIPIKDIPLRGPGKIIYDTDPKRLLEKLLELVKKEKMVLIKDKTKNNKPVSKHDDNLRE